ncbi:LacI family DNA-binding transcriptional regulator [Pedobacter sp. AW1-32]|uniref:LacI family DNA-binding transcriptional regulator n=1 Tax=Pedobacter sp. AW1-32 TaxID=3383026 RepID=UPI003FEEE72E
MGKVGMKDLALRLNLSTATISKALRDSYDIGEETKARVLALAKELNYSPNPHASYLRRKQCRTIAIVVPDIADSFFARLVNGAEEVALSEGFDVMIYLSHDKPEREQSILAQLANGRVDGVLISVVSRYDDYTCFENLKEAGVDIVFFDRILEEIGDGSVITNDFEASRQLTRHLIESGCYKIAFLSPSDVLFTNQQRSEGYIQAHADCCIKVDADRFILCSGSEPSNLEQIKNCLKSVNPPDAFIASGEDLILPLYQACAEMNISIPDEVKLAAFSNAKHAAILSPSVTTITQPAFEMGQTAAALLIKMVNGKIIYDDERTVILPSKLDIRSSSQNQRTL